MSNDKIYVKNDVTLHEYMMHRYVYDLHIVNIPSIISYDEETKVMTMEKINNMCISDMYGEKAKDISRELFDKVRKIITLLYHNNIEYPDITGYNFIEWDNKLWIIDFEHSKKSTAINNKFIDSFIRGKNEWNREFA